MGEVPVGSRRASDAEGGSLSSSRIHSPAGAPQQRYGKMSGKTRGRRNGVGALMGALSLPVLLASPFASFIAAFTAASVPALYAVSAPLSASAAPGKLPPRRQVGSSWDVEAREYLGNPQS